MERFFLLLALLVALPTAAVGTADPLAAERGLFIQAWRALEQGRLSRYRQLAPRLRDYPLYPYLEEKRLRRRLSRASDDEIRGFLERYPDTVLAERLRRSWLYRLARKRAWKRFLAFYQPPQPVELQCHRLRATLERPPSEEWLTQARALWLTGRSRPDACDPVFEVLYASPVMTPALIWQRIELAMTAGKPSLARYLGKKLSAKDRRWVELWRLAHRRPATALRRPELRRDTPLARKILAHAIHRLARNDPRTAQRHWQDIRDRYRFDDEQRIRIQRDIALRAAWRHLPEAAAYLAVVPPAGRDGRVHEWIARTALRAGDWQALRGAIEAFPPAMRETPEWRYWLAIAQQRLGETEAARERLAELARLRNFHGFLAADRLGQPYRMGHRPITASDADIDALLERRPAVLRAAELYRAGLVREARREWYWLVERLEPRELEVAAVLFHRLNWHDRAIATIAKSQHLDDLDLRFPLVYAERVREAARQQHLDPAWIYGIMRQESAFMADARSAAGALGLMQLMPATGRTSARLLGLRRPNSRTLLQPDANIRLGSAYLKRMLERFSDNLVLATAAYNAGPVRVRRWLPEERPLPADRWIDSIPYGETRGYVRGVLAFTTVYDSRLDDRVLPLVRRMPDIPPRPADAS